jgi:putative FmdB family regulatory protein
MPLYEFTCKECGSNYEELVSLNCKEYPPCPSCKSEKVEKKMSVFGGVSSGGSSCSGRSGFT